MKEVKCQNNVELGCGDTCCLFCIGANECKYACTGRPDECGMAKKKVFDKDQEWD